MKAIIVFLLLAGCASQPKLRDPAVFTSNECMIKFRDQMDQDTNAQLDHVSDLFRQHCYNETIQVADYIRSWRRDKYYSMTTEFAEVFTPEGSFTPYILESYERSYLALLIAASHLNAGREEDALVELRRAVNEENARLYNHGEDPVISFLLAALWDRFDSALSRPHWKALSERRELDPAVARFARQRMQEIDRGEDSKVRWRISMVGTFPDLDWHSRFFSDKPYKIVSRTPFPKACAGQRGLLLPTESWAKKISNRYDSDYHPWLFTKSLFRLPVGVAYGAIVASTGVGVGVGGCALAASAKESSGELCDVSLAFAGQIIGESSNLVEFTLRPDMRHWKKVPLAFLIERSGEHGGALECPDLNTLSLPRQTLVGRTDSSLNFRLGGQFMIISSAENRAGIHTHF